MSTEIANHGLTCLTYIRTSITNVLSEAEPGVENVCVAGALLGRSGLLDDFKAPVIFLLAERSRFMTGSD